MVNRESRSTKTQPKTAGLKQLPDSALLAIIALANQEARRRGIAIEKPSIPPERFHDAAGGSQLQLIQALMAVMVDPSVRNRLKTSVGQALLGGCELAGQATALLEQTKRNIETIVGQDLFKR